MKKLYLLMLLIAGYFSSGAKAQWNENLDENLLISETGYGNQDLVQIGKTGEDKVFIAWLSWENENSYVKLQLLDKEGNPLFEKGGIYVSKYPTPSWSSGYGFAVTQDNCVVIVNSDLRNGEWQPYAYKISSSGEQLWGKEGIALLKKEEGSGLNPHICVTNKNNFIIGYQNMAKSGTDVKLIKLLGNGSYAWGDVIALSGANGIFDMVPSEEDGVIVTYYEAFSSSTGNFVAMKYSANGEEAWDEKINIDGSGLAKVTSEPSVISDGDGGLIVGWRFADSGFSTAGKIQKVNSEGKILFEEEGVQVGDLPAISKGINNNDIYAGYVSGALENRTLWLSKFDENGKEIWSTADLTSQTAYQFAIYGMVPVEDGLFIIYRNATRYNEATIEYTKVDNDGIPIVKNIPVSIAQGDKGHGGVTSMFQKEIVVAWTDNSTSTEGGGLIYAQNIDIYSGPLSVFPLNVEMESPIISLFWEENKYGIDLWSQHVMQAIITVTGLDGKVIADLKEVMLHEGKNRIEYSSDNISQGLYIINIQLPYKIISKKFWIK